MYLPTRNMTIADWSPNSSFSYGNLPVLVALGLVIILLLVLILLLALLYKPLSTLAADKAAMAADRAAFTKLVQDMQKERLLRSEGQTETSEPSKKAYSADELPEPIDLARIRDLINETTPEALKEKVHDENLAKIMREEILDTKGLPSTSWLEAKFNAFVSTTERGVKSLAVSHYECDPLPECRLPNNDAAKRGGSLRERAGKVPCPKQSLLQSLLSQRDVAGLRGEYGQLESEIGKKSQGIQVSPQELSLTHLSRLDLGCW